MMNVFGNNNENKIDVRNCPEFFASSLIRNGESCLRHNVANQFLYVKYNDK